MHSWFLPVTILIPICDDSNGMFNVDYITLLLFYFDKVKARTPSSFFKIWCNQNRKIISKTNITIELKPKRSQLKVEMSCWMKRKNMLEEVSDNYDLHI